MSMDNLVELEAFFPDIEPELSRCPTPVIENRIRDAIIESCERAHIWRWEHPPIPLIANQQNYTLTPPTADTLIHSILGLWINGRSVSDGSCEQTHESIVSPRSGYSISDRGQVRLATIPNRDTLPNEDGLQPLVSIKPSRTTLEVSEVLVRDYYQLIVTGTLSKALMMINRPWTNMELALVKSREYEIQLGRVRQAIDRNFRTGTQRFNPRKFSS